jgi:ribosome-binding factor A
MPDAGRVGRVAEEFREILGEEIPKLKDPRVGFVTVVGVTVTPDLRHARVAYTALGDESARKATAAALRSARGHLRQVIGSQVRLKVLPELEFEEDATLEAAARIERLIERIHRDEGAGEEGEERDG